MFGQNDYGYDGALYTDYNALEECFKSLRSFLISSGYKRVAMPYKIGCGRGGASWSIVLKMIDRIFYDCEVELWRLKEKQ